MMTSGMPDGATPDLRAGSPPSPRVFRPGTIVPATFLFAAGLALAGSLSNMYVGDENIHVRHASVYRQYGMRVPYDPMWAPENHYSLPLSAAPLWHAGLATLWRLWGEESQVVAQVYHAGFYALLVLSAYFAARRMWDESAAGWAWLLVATMPMVCAYSVLFLIDIPGIAVSALGLLLLLRKKYLWAGVVLGVAYLVKMNMLSFAPWALAYAVVEESGWKRRVWAALAVGVPVIMAFGYDMAWRMEAYGNLMGNVPLLPPGMAENASKALDHGRYAIPHYYPIYDPKGLLMHVGIAVPAGVVAAVLRARDRSAKWLWLCALVAGAGWAYVFMWSWALPHGWATVRYLFPALLPLMLLGGRGLSQLRLPLWLKTAILAGAAAQAVMAPVFISLTRQLPQQEKTAYAWIRENTPAGAVFLSSEGLVLTRNTGRPCMWNSPVASYIASEATDDERRECLAYYRISYICISSRRIYDPAKDERILGGYSADFVRHAREAAYLKKVYENPGVLIFEVDLAGASGACRPERLCTDGGGPPPLLEEPIPDGRWSGHPGAGRPPSPGAGPPSDACCAGAHGLSCSRCCSEPAPAPPGQEA
jgi:hypothetical protein